jgi:hypothetical protein
MDSCPDYYEQTTTTPADRDPGSLLAALSGSKAGISTTGVFCKGTLLKRMMKCGKAQGACRQDPDKRHGPYFEWTYKAKGKTVNVKLTPEVMPMFRAASQQYRRLKSLLNRLERLSQTVLRHQAKRAQSARHD